MSKLGCCGEQPAEKNNRLFWSTHWELWAFLFAWTVVASPLRTATFSSIIEPLFERRKSLNLHFCWLGTIVFYPRVDWPLLHEGRMKCFGERSYGMLCSILYCGSSQSQKHRKVFFIAVKHPSGWLLKEADTTLFIWVIWLPVVFVAGLYWSTAEVAQPMAENCVITVHSAACHMVNETTVK